MTSTVRDLLRSAWEGDPHYWRRESLLVDQWERNGRPVPPPNLVKQGLICEYAQASGARILVETGTYLGDTLYALRDRFGKLYSIELDEALHRKALGRFAPFSHVTLLRGDSGEKIGEVLEAVREPCVFWLDGHYSGGITARGSVDTPIMQELAQIFWHGIERHVVLIDDARFFVGQDGYPRIEGLRDLCLSHRPHWTFTVELDIIRLHPTLPITSADGPPSVGESLSCGDYGPLFAPPLRCRSKNAISRS